MKFGNPQTQWTTLRSSTRKTPTLTIAIKISQEAISVAVNTIIKLITQHSEGGSQGTWCLDKVAVNTGSSNPWIICAVVLSNNKGVVSNLFLKHLVKNNQECKQALFRWIQTKIPSRLLHSHKLLTCRHRRNPNNSPNLSKCLWTTNSCLPINLSVAAHKTSKMRAFLVNRTKQCGQEANKDMITTITIIKIKGNSLTIITSKPGVLTEANSRLSSASIMRANDLVRMVVSALTPTEKVTCKHRPEILHKCLRTSKCSTRAGIFRWLVSLRDSRLRTWLVNRRRHRLLVKTSSKTMDKILLASNGTSTNSRCRWSELSSQAKRLNRTCKCLRWQCRSLTNKRPIRNLCMAVSTSNLPWWVIWTSQELHSLLWATSFSKLKCRQLCQPCKGTIAHPWTSLTTCALTGHQCRLSKSKSLPTSLAPMARLKPANAFWLFILIRTLLKSIRRSAERLKCVKKEKLTWLWKY